MSLLNEMLEKAKAARSNAYAPYSNFFVGVCIRAEDDSLYAGCNVENAAYEAIHAESSAISALISSGRKKIKEVLVIGSGNLLCPPCGSCRQKIRELAELNIPIHMANEQGVQTTMTLEQLLPMSFGPENLE